jgi:hypothetical protein
MQTRFPKDYYIVDGDVVRTIEALMNRLYNDLTGPMRGDEMRDWANTLYAKLRKVDEYDPKAETGE